MSFWRFEKLHTQKNKTPRQVSRPPDRAGKDLKHQASTGDIISFLRLAVQRKEDFFEVSREATRRGGVVLRGGADGAVQVLHGSLGRCGLHCGYVVLWDF